MAIEKLPDHNLNENPCGVDIGRGWKQIVDYCLKDPTLFINILSLGTIFVKAEDYYEHRSATHYATFGEDMITSDAGDSGHHTTTTGSRTTHADVDSIDTTVKTRSIFNENYNVTTDVKIAMESFSRFLRAFEEISHHTKYHTIVADERIHISADDNEDGAEIADLATGVDIKTPNQWHPKDDIRISAPGFIKVAGEKVVLFNPTIRHCTQPPESCCNCRYPTVKEKDELPPPDLPWAPYPADPTQFSPFCHAEDIEAVQVVEGGKMGAELSGSFGDGEAAASEIIGAVDWVKGQQ